MKETMGIKRRKFLQLTGLTAAGTMLSSCGKGAEKLIPFLIPPDDGSIPGVVNYFASACRQCPAGCGTLVQVAEGRAKKIEGNPLHPVNQGRLCARGQAALQDLYHPDRIRQPMKRTGAKRSGAFAPISWAEGMKILVEQLKGLKDQGRADQLLLVTPRLQGSLHELFRTFMTAYGSPRRLSYEFLSTECDEQAGLAVYGRSDLPDYDIEHTQYLLSFGADFLETYLSPVRYGNAFGKMRQARPTIRGRFTYAGPRLSMTAASADRWLPVKTGQEGILALGMAKLILDEGLYNRQAVQAMGGDPEEWKARLSGYDLQQVAEATGLKPKEIASTAREFATIRPSLAMAGDAAAFQTNGRDAVEAIHFLNLLAGNVGKPGGVLFRPESSAPEEQSGFADLVSAIDAMQSQKIGLALVYLCNPVYSIPESTRFQEAFLKVPFVVSFSSIMDDTSRYADLILPDHSDLESWGDVIPRAGIRSSVTGVMQPVVRPIYDTRPVPDLILTASQALGGKMREALPYKNYLEMLKESVQKKLNAPSGPAFERIWVGILQKGGIFGPEQVAAPRKISGTFSPAPVRPPRFQGDEETYPLYLAVFPSPSLYDGREAHLPWLQELPDPMTTAVWGSWVEIHPKTAASLGIQQGDLVQVESPQGAIRVPAVIFPAIRPDLVAVPMGQGHQGMGRYASNIGANPLALLAPIMDEENRLPAWGATRVRLTRISDQGNLTVMGHPEGSYRGELMEI